MSSVSVERWQEIEKQILTSMSAVDRDKYISSMIMWAKHRSLDSTGRVPDSYELIEAGDIIFADWGIAYNMEIGYLHLGVVIAVIRGKALVVPLTSNLKGKDKDNLFEVDWECLDKKSLAFCNDAKFINTARVIKKIGKADEYQWRELKNYVMKGMLKNGWES